MTCTKCEYNGKFSQECLRCKNSKEQYSYRYQTYILDGYNPEQPDNSGSEKVTKLPDDIEDILRKFLYDLFDLSPLELLTLKAIMNGKSLEEFSKEITNFIEREYHSMKKNSEKKFTRFHAFQLRKSILKKLGNSFNQALLTTGQRKQLKHS